MQRQRLYAPTVYLLVLSTCERGANGANSNSPSPTDLAQMS